MRNRFTGGAIVAVAYGLASAQTPAPGPVFVSASVKPAALHSIRNIVGGPGTRSPQQISYTDASLQELLVAAYGLEDPHSISGPEWLDTLRYDVIATLPPGTTKEQLQQMLQNLLTKQFKLAIHHESKEVPAFDLVIAEGGVKLKLGQAPDPEKLKLSPEHGNYPLLPGDDSVPAMGIVMDQGRGRLRSRHEPLAVLAKMLGGPAGQPIVDKTGLPGAYDFLLDFDLRLRAGQAPKESAGPDDDPAPSLMDALEQQLGLKLAASRTAIDILVVDHAEKVPVGN